ncbi:MAG: fibronectin type III domain-containing protein [Steroidobacteraceae bacterium]
MQALADSTVPGAPTALNATAVSSTQVNVSWTAPTDNVGVTGYQLDRCSGSGCSTFAQIATPTATSYSDTGRTASTSYTYRVRATDANSNLSAYSNPVATVSTPAGGSGDTQAPTAPTGLAVLAASSSEIDLKWGAATDNVGVSLYLVERCLTSSCTYSQIGTIAASPYFDATPLPLTAYNYRVRAQDAATNNGPYSNVISITTPASSPDCN